MCLMKPVHLLFESRVEGKVNRFQFVLVVIVLKQDGELFTFEIPFSQDEEIDICLGYRHPFFEHFDIASCGLREFIHLSDEVDPGHESS